MKNFGINLLMAFFLFLSASSFAQGPGKTTKENRTAGDELIIAKKHFYAGAITIAAGGIFAGLGAASGDTDSMIMMGTLGGVIAFVGGIISIESFSHIGKAGKKLNEGGLGLNAGKDGLGICFKF